MTQDEALAEALRESQPGDIIALHGEACELRRDHPTGETCTCTPLVFVGSRAVRGRGVPPAQRRAHRAGDLGERRATSPAAARAESHADPVATATASLDG